MGTALVKLKIMPINTEVDLEAIKTAANEIIEKEGDGKVNFEIEEVAFGLKAIIAGFVMDESKQIDPIQDKITEIEGVNSAEVADFRRAFG